ncbi:DUF3139 domain-containing protein [Bacillus manliponensis]
MPHFKTVRKGVKWWVVQGFPINKDKLVNEVKTYLVEQSDSEDGFKSIEVEYHFTSGHCVDVVYKDEPNVIYTYRYIEDVSEKNSKGKKVLIYYVKLTDGQDEEIYQFKHMHQEL